MTEIELLEQILDKLSEIKFVLCIGCGILVAIFFTSCE